MTITEIINSVLAGGLLGALGQGIRTAVGLKKFNEENTAKAAENKPPEAFSISRMVISIFIGFVAGAIGMLVKGSGLAVKGDYSTESIITIITIGYSGADFIEGVFNTYIKKVTPAGAENASADMTRTADTLFNEQPLNVPDEANFSNQPAQG
jgi:hypothetical protein